MRRLSALAVLLCASPGLCFGPALAAEKLAPLDAEFLEYLASFGGDEEDWMLFADEEPAVAKPAPPAKEPAAKRDESKTEAAAKPAEKR
jgi:hypothetical protein